MHENDKIFNELMKQSVRWLKTHFFKKFELDSIDIGKLTDGNQRAEILHERYEDMSPTDCLFLSANFESWRKVAIILHESIAELSNDWFRQNFLTVLPENLIQKFTWGSPNPILSQILKPINDFGYIFFAIPSIPEKFDIKDCSDVVSAISFCKEKLGDNVCVMKTGESVHADIEPYIKGLDVMYFEKDKLSNSQREEIMSKLSNLTGYEPNEISNDIQKPQKLRKYRLGVSYRHTEKDNLVKSIVDATKGGKCWSESEIFFDRYTESEIYFSGIKANRKFEKIYYEECDIVVLFLTNSYNEGYWTKCVEFPVIEELCRTEPDRVILVALEKISDIKKFGLPLLGAAPFEHDEEDNLQIPRKIIGSYNEWLKNATII